MILRSAAGQPSALPTSSGSHNVALRRWIGASNTYNREVATYQQGSSQHLNPFGIWVRALTYDTVAASEIALMNSSPKIVGFNSLIRISQLLPTNSTLNTTLLDSIYNSVCANNGKKLYIRPEWMYGNSTATWMQSAGYTVPNSQGPALNVTLPVVQALVIQMFKDIYAWILTKPLAHLVVAVGITEAYYQSAAGISDAAYGDAILVICQGIQSTYTTRLFISGQNSYSFPSGSTKLANFLATNVGLFRPDLVDVPGQIPSSGDAVIPLAQKGIHCTFVAGDHTKWQMVNGAPRSFAAVYNALAYETQGIQHGMVGLLVNWDRKDIAYPNYAADRDAWIAASPSVWPNQNASSMGNK